MEDLFGAAGDRHDNDHQDFRDIRIMVTSDEVSASRLYARHAQHLGFGIKVGHQLLLKVATCNTWQPLSRVQLQGS